MSQQRGQGPTPGSSKSILSSKFDSSQGNLSLLERSRRFTGNESSSGGNTPGLFNTSASSLRTPLQTSTPLSYGGGSGLFSFSTPSASSSGLAHRGPYARPALLSQNRGVNPRYTPYSRKPIQVEAKKLNEGDDVFEPQLTSTAQRLIEILQKNTTPVADGLKKIAFNSPAVKKLRPNLTNTRTEMTGPPTTRLPYLLDKPNSSVPPKFLLGNLSRAPTTTAPHSNVVSSTVTTIAKTSPFAPIPSVAPISRSEQPFEFSFNYDSEKSSGGGKMKGFRTRVHEPPSRQPVHISKDLSLSTSTLVPSSNSTTTLVPKSDSSPFKFSEAWAFSELGGKKGTNPGLPNGIVEHEGFWDKLFSVVKNEYEGPPKLNRLFGPVLVNGGDEEYKTVPGLGFNQASPPKQALLQFKPNSEKKKEWGCPTCLVHNSTENDKCVCCETPNPDLALKKKGKEEPPPLLLQHKSNLEKKWNCPTCLVHNSMENDKCVCCETPNPSAPAKTRETTITKSGEARKRTADEVDKGSSIVFGFGSKAPSTSTVTSTNSATNPMVFGINASGGSSSTESKTSNFSFGFGKSSPIKNSVPDIPKTNFSFGIPSKSGETSTSIKTNPPQDDTAPPPAKASKPIGITESDPDAEVDKYKFKPFFGGPKPLTPKPPSPSPAVSSLISSTNPTLFGVTSNGPLQPPPSTPFSFGIGGSNTSTGTIGMSSIANSTTTTTIFSTPTPLTTTNTIVSPTPSVSVNPPSVPVSNPMFMFGSKDLSSKPVDAKQESQTPSIAPVVNSSSNTPSLFNPSTTITKTNGAPFANFSFGSATNTTSTPNMSFGQNTTTGSPSPAFTAAQPPPPANNFSFGSAGTTGMSPPPPSSTNTSFFMTPSTTTTAPVNASPNSMFTFGATKQLPESNNMFGGMNNTPNGTAAPPFANNFGIGSGGGGTNANAPIFSFGQNSPAGSQPVLFTAGSPPTSSTPGGEFTRRPIRKAVRRNR